MSIVVANGLLITEAAYPYADLVADNPIVPDKVAILSYTGIDASGAYIGLQLYIGSDIPFTDLVPVFFTPVGGKQSKAFTGSDMSTDSEFQYTLTPGDILAIGQTIQLTGLLVNGENSEATYTFSGVQGSLVAGDTIDFAGLPLKADVSTITFNLS